LVAAAVLSGNRNFEGRVHPHVRANYLASPPLVVAYALAGRVDTDLYNEPIGVDRHGDPVYLRDIWPSDSEIRQVISEVVQPEMFAERYADVFSGNASWNAIDAAESELYPWDPHSTYIQEPPFFDTLTRRVPDISGIRGARVLAVLGDSITTDHISPAGAISQSSPAGKFLVEAGVAPRDFNSYGSRRGNDRVMTRGTFANIRLRNRMVPGVEGGMTLLLPEGELMSIYDAAERYKARGVPLIVLAGKEYGTGSSRDWAAKGTLLLGVKAVLAESFERIHRSNLIGMGVLPLVYKPGENAESLGLTGRETFTIEGLDNNLQPKSEVTVTAQNQEDGTVVTFQAIVRIDTPIEVNYFRNGGILHTVVRNLLEEGQPAGEANL
jgi:aconitate hydratase